MALTTLIGLVAMVTVHVAVEQIQVVITLPADVTNKAILPFMFAIYVKHQRVLLPIAFATAWLWALITIAHVGCLNVGIEFIKFEELLLAQLTRMLR